MHIADITAGLRAAAGVSAGLTIDPWAAAFGGLAGRVSRHARESAIYAEASPATHVYKVISGVVRTCKLLPDGRRQIGEFALPGEIFGLDGTDSHFYTAEAVGDCTVMCYPRRAVEALAARDGNAVGAMQRLMLNSLSAAQRSMLALARKTAVERVASFLLEMHQRARGERGRIDLPMPRHDIADHLGLTMETVSRAFGILKRSGAVALDGAHRVLIRNRAALEGLGGEVLAVN